MSIKRYENISRILLGGAALVLGAAPLLAQQPAAQNAQPQPAHAQQPGRHALDMTLVKPESVGFSSERLERLHALMQQTVDEKHLAGVVTILARHGKVVDYRTYGQRDIEAGLPVESDTLPL